MRVIPAIAVMILIGYSVPASAQTATLRGFVSTETSRPLQGASVVLKSNDVIVTGSSTDGDGYFILSRVAPGTYSFEVSFLGFVTHRETVSIGAAESRLVRVTLADAPAESLDDLVVEAQSETGVVNVRAGLQTITAADVSSVPVPGVSGDLASYLQSIPGVVAQGDRGGQVFVRGGAIDQNLATLDGFPIYYPFHILSFYSAFPEDVIDQAQFYTAGFGASYGSRVSSVVDVTMRNGNKQRLAGSVAVAPFMSGVHVEGPLVKDRVSMIVAVRESLVKKITPNVFGQKFPYEFGDRFGKLHATIGSNHSVSVTGLYTYDRGDLAGTRHTVSGDPIPEAPVDSNEVGWTNALVGGHYLYRGARIPLLADFSAGWSRLTNDVGPAGEPERTSGIESQDFAADLTYFLTRGDVRAGMRVRQSTFDYDVGGLFEDLSVGHTDLTELIGYAETRLRFGGIELNPGLQLYKPTAHSAFVDPRFRAQYQLRVLDRPVSLHGAAGVYHQVASGLTDERDIGNVYTAWSTTPGDAAVPRSIHYVAGARVHVDQYLSVAVEGFSKDFTSLSVPIFSASPQFTTSVQPADGLARGIDGRIAVVGYPLDEHWKIDVSVSYSFAKVEYSTATVSYSPAHDRRKQATTVLKLARGEFALLVQNQFGSGLPYTASAGFDAWILLTPEVDVSSEPGLPRLAYDEPFGERLPNYVRTDVWIQRKVDSKRAVLTLRAGAVNIFDRDNLFYFDLFTFSRVNQLPLIPSIGLKADFH